MTKLLNRPLKAFALYSLIILLISVPVYVIVVDYIWVTELDEHNSLALEHTKKSLESRKFSEAEIEKINQIWGELQPGVSISKCTEAQVAQDSVYEVVRPNSYDIENGADRFRGLKSNLKINDQSYQITIETNVEEAGETMLAVAIVTFFFFVVLIAGFILLNRRIAKSSWRPFYQTLEVLKSFDISKDNDLQSTSTDIQEFQELNQSLTQLVKNNVAAYQQQKSFIENASHELQTPIAILKSKLDLLIQQKNISADISAILNGIEAPLSRLSRINKNLLVLAKVENHQYSEQQVLDVRKYLKAALSLFEDYIEANLIIVTSEIDETPIVTANSFLLETLIQNLLSNAIRHTSSGGQIQVKSIGNSIRILNSGIKTLDKKHLFERFSATTKDKVGSGLGLAIIKEISNKYNWKVEYSFDNGFHTFSVEF